MNSCRLSWAIWAMIAGMIALCTKESRRRWACPGLAAFLLAVLVHQAFFIAPMVAGNEWTEAWGILASFGAFACWLGITTWGTDAIVRNAEYSRQWLIDGLSAVLIVNLLAIYCQWLFGFRYLWVSGQYAGFLPSWNVWGLWVIMAFPLLFDYSPRRALVGIACLATVPTPTCWAALLIGAAIFCHARGYRKSRNTFLAVMALALAAGIKIMGPERVNALIWVRLQTWYAVAAACVHYPFGAGGGPMAYWEAVGLSKKLLPHPASGFLAAALFLGLPAGAVVLGFVRSGYRAIRSDALSMSLCVGTVAFFIKNLFGLPHALFLLWVLWLAWRIERSDRDAVQA